MALSNKEIPTDLREYIEINILPQYATFDKAHRLNHAEKVIEESMKLAQYYEVEPAMVYTIAAYHDLGLCEGREFHHLISGNILAADEKLRKWFSEAQLQTMKEAVEDHRASNKQAPRSKHWKIGVSIILGILRRHICFAGGQRHARIVLLRPVRDSCVLY